MAKLWGTNVFRHGKCYEVLMFLEDTGHSQGFMLTFTEDTFHTHSRGFDAIVFQKPQVIVRVLDANVFKRHGS